MKLELQNVHVETEGKKILSGVTLTVDAGTVHALMGPNGSGKSTLSQIIAGNPAYELTEGKILVDGREITELSPDERAKKGIFLAFQNPVEIAGVSFSKLLFTLLKTKDPKISIVKFNEKLTSALKILDLDKSFVERDVNVGFSGGEKKRAEILQLLMLEPKLVILDEMDSGLDIDSLKLLSKAVSALRGPNFTMLVITHYQRLLDYIVPDVVSIIARGQIKETGGPKLAKTVEAQGYQQIIAP